MPNQNYFEAREELKMAQCDLSLSYPTCKTEERLCKLAYTSWCPTCDKDSPRRRSKSETNEPCRKKGREMKGTPRKYDWNQECENMELEYEAKDIRFDTCRIRSNLCELPTTYITNNCQMMKLSSCPSDFVDSTEKSIKCYENNLKSNDLTNRLQNFGSMVDRQDRLSKLFPRIEEATRNITGNVNNGIPKFETLKSHGVSPINSSSYLESKTSPKNIKHPARPHKLKPTNGTTFTIDPLSNLNAKNNDLWNLELRNKVYDLYHREQQTNRHTIEKTNHDLHFKPILKPPSVTKSEQIVNSKKHEVKPHVVQHSSNIHYDTCTFFDKKVDVSNLNDRYAHEVALLKDKLKDLKNNVYDNHPKPASAPVKWESMLKVPTPSEVSDIPKIDSKRVRHSPHHDATGAVPKIPLLAVRKQPPVEPTPPVQIKRDRMKCGSSKVSLKTKSKLSTVKLKKQPKNKATNNVVATDILGSDCSDSEDSENDKDANLPEKSESVDELSTASSVKQTISNKSLKLLRRGSGDADNWPLRQSLFPNIPPYLKFDSYDSGNAQKLPAGNRFLKWKLSTITPILVRKTLTNSGFRLVRKSNEWLGTWGKHMKSPMFRTLKETQKLNHFPGTFQIGRKDRLWRNFQKLILKHGQKEFGFIPQTYVLPQDLKLLKHHWQYKNGTGNEKYIIKPPASARGTGIKVINRWSQLPKRMSLVVQEYISNPYLINGSKFDLRLYVLVTSFDPLRIYLYPDGLVRFASVPYSDDVKDLNDKYMHLTNYSINKMSSLYTANEDANACKGHKWTLSKLWEYLQKRDIDTKALWKNLKQLVIKTLISGESSIVALCKENMNSRYNCYELFGIDVLLDTNLKAWLLEVNISPSLHSQSPLDEHVKGPMVKALFELAQFHLPPKLGRAESRYVPPCLDPRIYTTSLTKTERNKHNYYSQSENRAEYLEDILVDLTGDDVRHLTQAEDEMVVIGRFEKIFPTAHSHKYLPYLDVRYYNRLFDAWECKYDKNKKAGVKILRSLCEQKMHLKVAPPTVLTKSSLTMIPGEQNLLPVKEVQKQPIIPPPPIAEISTPSPTVEVEPKTEPLKSPMDIQSLYNALRLQSERGNMYLRHFPRSDYSTQV